MKNAKAERLAAKAPEILRELEGLHARVTTMAWAMRKRGLDAWVRDWLGDGILEDAGKLIASAYEEKTGPVLELDED